MQFSIANIVRLYPNSELLTTVAGTIRVRLWEGERMVADSGSILDTGDHTSKYSVSFSLLVAGPESLRGGRLGVYCDSQVPSYRL